MTTTTDRSSLTALMATLIVTNAGVTLTVLQYGLLG
jgi:hypothetical protein